MPRVARTELDDKGRRFCVEYAKGKTTFEAAIIAGFAEATAKIKAPQWIKHPMYVEEINRLRSIVGAVIDTKLKAAAPKPKQKTQKKELPPYVAPETPDIDAEMRAHAERIAEAAAAVNISKEWVLKELVATYLRATQGSKPNGAVANQSLNLIGTELGMFVRRQQIEYKDISTMTPQEAQAETAKALAELGDQVPAALLALLQEHVGTVQ
ncbi:MAG: hypothetical protein JWN23_1557 [Rhodocyclales bacterium]|nr:hypothetical protein [Rhodocyclales bacterium]